MAEDLSQFEQRFAALEARVRELEDGATPQPVPGKVDIALLNRLAHRNGPGYRTDTLKGAVTYAGSYSSGNGDLAWHSERPVPLLLSTPPEDLSALFAALGNPARLGIVQHLLEHGPSDRATLQDLVGTDSSGQLYHHLNSLIDAGLVRLLKRGVYTVEAANTVKVLALLCAAYDVADAASNAAG